MKAMSKIISIDISQLKPGMILGQDIRDNPNGIILLSAGSKITVKALLAIKKFNIQGKCLVYTEECSIGSQENHHQEIIKQKISRQVPIKINKRDLQARKIYKDTFKTVKDFYNKSGINANVDLYDITKAAEGIAAEIINNHQVLIQIALLKAVDNYTFSHAVHVSIYVSALAKFLNFTTKQLQEISLAGLLHDIGKMDIPLDIVNKPGKLSDSEFSIMKEHVRYSFNRLCNFSELNDNVLSAILQHHERMDGSGYPQKLRGEQIHHWARLLAIADVYDAVTTDRVYRNALLPHEGAEILMGNSGKLDMQYLNIFLRNMTFYPVGCKVVLSTGEIGTVVALHRDMPFRPVIRITGEDSKDIRTINLLNNLTTFITGIVKD